MLDNWPVVAAQPKDEEIGQGCRSFRKTCRINSESWVMRCEGDGRACRLRRLLLAA